MGLFLIQTKFVSHPPAEDAFRAALIREVGSDTGLDSFAVKDGMVEITTSLDPVTSAYAFKILHEFGGQQVISSTGNTCEFVLPEYVQRPWRKWPWWKRAGIYARFYLGLASPAKDTPKL